MTIIYHGTCKEKIGLVPHISLIAIDNSIKSSGIKMGVSELVFVGSDGTKVVEKPTGYSWICTGCSAEITQNDGNDVAVICEVCGETHRATGIVITKTTICCKSCLEKMKDEASNSESDTFRRFTRNDVIMVKEFVKIFGGAGNE